MSKELKELEKIEYSKKSWKVQRFKEQQIWQEIAMQINSSKGYEQKFWCRVMDLFKEKYRA